MHKSFRLSVVLAGLIPLASGCGEPLESPTLDAALQTSRSEALTASSWTANAPLRTGRENHTLTVLDSGLVLAAGGTSAGYEKSAELYNPYADSWSATSAMNEVRANARATRLASGKVLVVGGQNHSTPAIRTAELYDPATGTWSYTGSLNTGRSWFTLTPLDSGKVLVTGGMDESRGFTATAEVYDPATGTWSYTGPKLFGNGFFQAAAKLYSGEVLVTGNISASTAEVYNPATNSWRAVAGLPGRRYVHTQTLLYTGEVLVVGGGEGQGPTQTAYLYNPFSDSWTRLPDTNRPRGQDHTATLLYSGKVLVASDDSAEIFDPATRTWTLESGARINGLPPAALLHTGQVLYAGTSVSRYTP